MNDASDGSFYGRFGRPQHHYAEILCSTRWSKVRHGESFCGASLMRSSTRSTALTLSSSLACTSHGTRRVGSGGSSRKGELRLKPDGASNKRLAADRRPTIGVRAGSTAAAGRLAPAFYESDCQGRTNPRLIAAFFSPWQSAPLPLATRPGRAFGLSKESSSAFGHLVELRSGWTMAKRCCSPTRTTVLSETRR
jgi:hypothetical protein